LPKKFDGHAVGVRLFFPWDTSSIEIMVASLALPRNPRDLGLEMDVKPNYFGYGMIVRPKSLLKI